MTDQGEANETVAKLLGWEYGLLAWDKEGDQKWVCHTAEEIEILPDGVCPDFTSWERFPELQAYFSSLTELEMKLIAEAVFEELEGHGWGTVIGGVLETLDGITPTILRDAIVAVCGAEVEE